MRRVLNWLIAKAAPADERDAIIGDLMEEYEQRVRPARGPWRASAWYARQSLLACGHAWTGRRQPAFTPAASALGFARDLRYAARGLRRSPAFAIAAIVSLAVGIGAATAIFSVANPVLFQSLPYPAADRILTIWYTGADGARVTQAFGNYRELAARTRAFEAMAVTRTWQPTITGSDEPERLDGQRVTPEYLRVLGVPPALGSAFDPAEDRPGGANIAIISDGLWRRRFGADQAIVGRRVLLNDLPYTVIGVMPREYEDVLAPRAQIWSLLQYDPALPPQGREWGHHLRLIARLTSGTNMDVARRDLDQIARAPIAEFARPPWCSMRDGLTVSSLQDDVAGPVRPALIAVIGGVVLVLMIACLNVTNLLLARGGRRHGEVVLRAALGAGRARLVRQFVAESLLVSLIGGAGGLLVAAGGIRALVALGPPDLPRLRAIGLDGNVFLFCTVVAALVGVVVGLVPALQVARAGLRPSDQRGSAVTRGSALWRRGLVIAEVALAGVLLVGAGLLFRSVERLLGIAPGFDASHVVAMQVQVATPRRFPDSDAIHRFFGQALDAVHSVPGVTAAAFTSQLPLSGDDDVYGVKVERQADDTRAVGDVTRYAVTPAYFDAMRIPLLKGRAFDDRDMAAAPARPVIVNAAFAARVFAGEDPIGRRVRLGGAADRPWDVVVGVVGDVKQASLAMPADAVYATTAQWLWADNPRWLVVRAAGDATALVPAIKAAIWSVDRDQPIVRVSTMEALLARSAAGRSFALLLFEAFGLFALVLAAAGLYGVLSGSVTERTREIGVRAALGATRHAIVVMIFREGLALTVIGLVAGLGAGALASASIDGLLFGISRLDVLTYAGVAVILVAVSALACWLPAWRAASVDPLITLRSE